MRRLIILVLMLGGMQLILPLGTRGYGGQWLLIFGFLIVAAEAVGGLSASIGLPKIVGYLFAGLLFGYFVIAPLTIGFLSQYSVSEQVTNMIDVGSYLSTVLNVSIACAVVFQLPLLVYFLTRMGLVSPDFLRRYRRHALVALAILSAVITPPDVFSMILVLLPLFGLYEYSIRISERTLRRSSGTEGTTTEGK